MDIRKILLTLLIIFVVSIPLTVIADDHGGTWQTATDIGTLISSDLQNHVDFSGEIEVPGDTDWFSFYATASLTDENYIITLTSWLFANPIYNVKISLYSTDGTTEILSDIESECNAYGSLNINWKCSDSGTYYLKVQGYGSSCDTGEYLGSVNIVKSSSDDSDDDCFIATASYSNNENIVFIIDKTISLLAELSF